MREDWEIKGILAKNNGWREGREISCIHSGSNSVLSLIPTIYIEVILACFVYIWKK